MSFGNATFGGFIVGRASRPILSVLIDLSDFRVMSSAWRDTLKISRKETPLFNT
jgi:hypothetical protein